MAVAGSRSTTSYSSDYSVGVDTFLRTLESVTKTSGPSWVSVEDASWDTIYGRDPDTNRQTIDGYRFSCRIVFEPGTSVEAGDYSYSFDIILRQIILGGTNTIGTVSGTETVTAAPEETPEPTIVPIFQITGLSDAALSPGESESQSFEVIPTGSPISKTEGPSWVDTEFVRTRTQRIQGNNLRVDVYNLKIEPGSSVSPGTYNVKITATYPSAGSVPSSIFQSIVITIRPSVDLPVLPSFSIIGNAGSSFRQTKSIVSNEWRYVQGRQETFGSQAITIRVSSRSVTISGTIPSSAVVHPVSGRWSRQRRYTVDFRPPTSVASYYDDITLTGTATISLPSVSAPEYVSPPQTVVQPGQAFSININPQLGGGGNVTYSISGPNFGSVSGDSIVGTAPNRTGTWSWSVTATNSQGSGSTTARLIVRESTTAENPTLGSIPNPLITTTPGSSISGSLSSYASGPGTLSFRKSSGAGWISVASNGAISGTAPSGATTRTYSVSFLLISSTGGFTSGSFNVRVEADDDPPSVGTIPSPLITVNENQSGSGSLSSYVSGDGTIVFSKTGGASWITISGDGSVSVSAPSVTRNTSFTGSFSAISIYGSASGSFTVRVNNVTGDTTTVPAWDTPPSGTVFVGQSFSIDLTPSSGGGTYSYSKTSGPAFGSISGSNLTGTAPSTAGNRTFGISVTNSAGTGTTTATVRVRTRPTPTTIGSIPNPLITVDENKTGTGSLSSYVTAQGIPTYSKTSGPTWISIGVDGSITATAPSVTTNTTYSAGFSVSGGGGTATGSFNILVRNVAGATITVPAWDTPPSATVFTGASFSIDLTPSSGGGTYSYSKTSGPAFGTISGSNLTGTAPNTTGARTFGISVTNSAGTGTTTATLTVNNRPTPLTISSIPNPLATVQEGQSSTASISSYVSGSGAPFSFSKASGPSWITVNRDGSIDIARTPSVTSTTNYSTSFLVASSTGATGSGSFTVRVTDVSNPPTIGSIPDPLITINENSSTLSSVSSYVTGDGTFIFRKTSGPSWALVGESGAIVVAAPSVTSDSTFSFGFSVSSEYGTSAGSFNVRVNNVGNTIPAWDTSPSGSVNINQPFSIDLTPSSGGGTYSYSKTSGPAFGTISGNSLIGTAPANAGTHDFGISVTNDAGTGTTTATLTVVGTGEDLPDPPSIGSITDPLISVNETVAGTGSLTSFVTGDGTLTYSRTSGQTWASISSDGSVSVTGPNVNSDTTFSISFSVSSEHGSANGSFNVLVRNVEGTTTVTTPSWNTPPSGSANVNQSFTIDLTPSSGGGTYSYSITGPSFGSVSGSSIVGTAPANAGTETWSVSVTNSAGTGTTTATLTVVGVGGDLPDPPSVGTITDPLITLNESTSSTSSLTSFVTGDGTLSYSKSSGPSWVTVDSDGSISVSAPSVTLTTTSSVGFTVTSQYGSATGSFNVRVNNVEPVGPTTTPSWNNPPTGSVVVGQTFSINIAADSGGGTITYSATGPAFGSISGTSLTGTAPSTAGTHTWSISGTNSAGTGTTTATLTVIPEPTEEPTPEPTPTPTPGPTPLPGNQPPSFLTIPNPLGSVGVGTTQNFFIGRYVTGSGTVVISKTSGPSWVTVFGNGNVRAAPPSGTTLQTYSVGVDAISIYGSATSTINIRVTADPSEPPVTAPVISPLSDSTIAGGQRLNIDISGSITGEVTSYTVTSTPSIPGLQISNAGVITSNNLPIVTQSTTYTITATATNSAGSDSESFTLTVRVPDLPRFLEIPDSALQVNSRASYSIDMSTYAENYTSLSFLESIPWASVSGTTLSGTAPYLAQKHTWTFGVVLENDDGTVSMTYTITGFTLLPPTFITNASLNAEVLEGEGFDRNFNGMIIRGNSPYGLSLASGFSLSDSIYTNWLTFRNGILTGSAAPFVSMDQTSPPIRITVTDSANRSSTISFTITILNGEGRERPRFTAIPEQVMIPGRSFILPLISSPAQASDYLSGDVPISISQDDDEEQHAWLRVQPDGTGGFELIGNVPYDRNQVGDRIITVSLLAENQFGEDRVSFNGRIKGPSVGVPFFQRIGVLRRKENTRTVVNPQAFLSGSPALVTLKAGSESESWFRPVRGGYGGTTPTIPVGQDRIFENNTFVAQNRFGTVEENFVFEIYREAVNFEWTSQISNIDEYEGEPVNYDVSRFARANANNEFRFAADQPNNDVTWANLTINTEGLIESPAAPTVGKNESYSVTVEGRINTTEVWVSSTFIITILNDVRGAVRWSVQIPHQRVNENTIWSFPTIGFVTGTPPISISFTTGRNIPPGATITTRGVISFRGGRTPSVNRNTQITFYLTANNYQGILAKTFFEMTILNVGPTLTGPSLNPLVTIERNANTPLNESIVSLMVITSTGNLSFRKDSGVASILISRNGYLIGRTPNIRITNDYDIGMTVTDDTGSSTAILRVKVIGFAGQQQPSFEPFDLPDINEATDMYYDLNRHVRGADGTVIGLAVAHEWLYVRAGILRGRAPNVFRDTPVRVQIDANNVFGTTVVTKNFTVIDVGSLTWDEGIGATRTVNRGGTFRLDCNDYLSGEKPHDIVFTPNKFYPSWLSMTNGVISGTCPAEEPLGSRRIFITGSNNHGRLETSFILNVVDDGVAPTISGLPDLVRNEGSEILIECADYTTGEDITYLMTGHPSELSIDRDTGRITGRLAEVPSTKNYDIRVDVDNDNGDDFDVFKLTNTDVPEGAPKFKPIDPIVVIEGRSINRQLADYLEDSTEFPVEFFKTPGNISPAWINIDRNSGLASGRAEPTTGERIETLYITAKNHLGQDSITVKVTTQDAVTGEQPQWRKIQDLSVNEGDKFEQATNHKLIGQAIIGFNPNPVDADGNVISWEAPDWIEISNDGTGFIKGIAPFINKPQEITPVYLIAINQDNDGNLQSAATSFNIINNDVTGLRPEIVKVGIPEGYINGEFTITVDFNVDVTDVSLDSFDFTGVNIKPHTLYHGLTSNSRGSVTQRSTVARYFSLRFPAPADGAIGNLNVHLRRHGVRIALTAIGEG